jgi:squalene-associated FAD-dependent desaturase
LEPVAPTANSAVVIIGGGLAGLAAAVALGSKGVPVTLLESRPRLGGRASSIVDRTTGETIDNCQHVTMGCCTHFAHFCRTTGLDRFLKTEPSLYFIGPDGTTDEFSANHWPAPLHLAGAFGRLRYLKLRDRVSIARGLRDLARTPAARRDSRSFAEWLRDHRQTPAAIEYFWHVVLVSALSESLDRIDVSHARKVFVDGFLKTRDGWQVQVPTVPLETLYGVELVRWLEGHGVTLRLQTGVERLTSTVDRVTGIELRGGESLPAEDLILAVPHTIAPALLPPGLIDHPSLTRLQQLETSPIASVHLWFDRPITDLPHAVLIGRLSQWIFRRSIHETPHAALPETATQSTALQQPSGEPATPSVYYQVVISASRDLDGIPAEGVVARVVDELAEIWPEARKARLRHSRVITEHRAVFAPTPGVDALRPSQQTILPNLQLAGDWTRTGWPATMEGAVRSGYLAAENVLSRRGQSVRIRPHDPAPGFLPTLLFGLS